MYFPKMFSIVCFPTKVYSGANFKRVQAVLRYDDSKCHLPLANMKLPKFHTDECNSKFYALRGLMFHECLHQCFEIVPYPSHVILI